MKINRDASNAAAFRRFKRQMLDSFAFDRARADLIQEWGFTEEEADHALERFGEWIQRQINELDGEV